MALGRCDILSTLLGAASNRIARLEGEIAGLWRYVKAQKPNVPPGTTDSVVDEVTDDGQGGNDEIDSESEMSDASPATALLFNNSLLDSQDVPEQVSQHPRQQKSSEARLSRARSALQCLIIPEENAAALVARAAEWVTWANSIAPLVFVARTKDELMLDWDQARGPEAQPTMIAAVLLITAMTIHLAPQSSLHGQLSDASAYSKTVSDVIETYIVNDDFFAGSLEGIEKVWLSLRRTIALAEIIGLPRASVTPSGNQSGNTAWTSNGQTREEAGALLWQTACTMERLAGCMFGLPITAKMNPFPTERPVFVGTHLVPQAYFCRLADIAGKIPALDDLYAKGRPSHQLCSMVLNIDSEFRDLASLAPRSWWDVHPNPERITVDLVFQYFHQYFTARAHLQLALNNDATNIYAYSHIVCTEACRNLAVRYAALRPLVLGGFFPVRLFDVQALTAAIFLLHTCYCPGSSQTIEAAQSPTSRVLIQQIVESMDLASHGITGHFAQEAARTIRSLAALLSNNSTTDSPYISLRVPLLGRIHVRRQDAKPKSAESLAGSSAAPPPTSGTRDAASMLLLRSGRSANVAPLEAVANDPNSWSIEISEVVPFLTDGAYAPDQWLMLGDLDTGDFSFEQASR
ncbi:hypothetical protein LTR02_006461 [Friedmanniomyces endolithicus]|nr:hypothetical protein LTR94_004627 [Friedmanniomyces endolithicus]KAK0787280.1 hypothetical protein LTR38_011703 [Friedmanniomyces endolithicus]KAK0794860.1 hypothetical protein LTR75_010702 [Friedmanniomyces endolithicus]KAK0800051.1 hypothetical protein LTR59_005848 [Friedmanniomyces endolithicus]KAK0859901.1 hypothetical protein LTS02_008864 [Friedmanniomyces endolithicus]